jgi:hypothetical protein
MTNFIKQFRAADKVSTPLVAIRTFDNASTISSIMEDYGPKKAAVVWDCVNGYVPKTDAGSKGLSKAITAANSQLEITVQLQEAVRVFGTGKDEVEDMFIFIANAHLFWTDPNVIQGIWNLRDKLKPQGSMLVLLVSSGAILPPELAGDFLVLDESLPSADELGKIVTDTFEFAKLAKPSDDILKKATNALIGLPAFAAEQSTAMCLDIPSKTLNITGLWERKRQTINQTRGLSVYTGKDKFDDVGGLANVKNFLTRIMEGNDPPHAIIFLDEIEKGFAGNGTDTSGVKTELTGAYLSWSEDNQVMGIMNIGLPGVGKSQLPKTLGNKYGIPFIKFDIAGMQDSLVGNSGTYLRNGLAVIDAVSDKKVLAIATCNSIDSLPPELQSRFQLATFFYDAPTEEERASIWGTYRKVFNVSPKDALPPSEGWTGREIKGCCEKAYRLNVPLIEAAKYVVPCTISNAHRIEDLRRRSSGKYLSASYEGFYTYKEAESAIPFESGTVGRKLKG